MNTASNAFFCTVMFCDIRGFTQLFEKVEPREAFLFIESFYSSLTEAVIAEKGTVVNLNGDGILAQFGIGSEIGDETHSTRAVNCAIDIRKRVVDINQQRYAKSQATFSFGIGIHCGLVAAGEIELTGFKGLLLVGDTVNFASRIESLTKDFSVDVLASRQVYDRVQKNFPLMPMALRKVRGKTNLVESFWLLPQAKKAPYAKTASE